MPTRPLVTSYEDELRRFPDRWQQLGVGVGAGILLALPFLVDARWLTVSTQALTCVVGAVAMMILTGFAGQISLGHAAFLALGAYTTAVLGGTWHVPFWVGVPAGGLVAAGVGLAVGPFALRLRGLYLAIVTLGILFLVDHALLSFPDLTGGVSGLAVPVHARFSHPEGASPLGDWTGSLALGPVVLSYGQKLYFLFLAVASAATLLCANLRRSRTGRAMIAVRDSDLAAEALGVDPAGAKVLAFGLSSFLAGIAGGMFALQQQYLTVDPPFGLDLSVQYVAMVVLGGLGTTFGAVAGPVAFVFLGPVAERVGRELPLLSSLSSAQQSTLLFGALVIGFLVFEPLGLYGIWLRVKRYFLAWPFRY